MSTIDGANRSEFSPSKSDNAGELGVDEVVTVNAAEPIADAVDPSPPIIVGSEEGENMAVSSLSAPEVGVTELETVLRQMTTTIESLQSAFDSKIRYDDSKQQTIDTLHQELQLHREGLHFRLLRPIFIELIDMYIDLDKLLKRDAAATPQPENEVRLLRNLESFQSTIEEVLFRNGVVAYVEEGERLVAQRQRALKTIETEDPTLDGAIAERMRKGFAYEDRILRPETVTIYKLVRRSQEP